MSKREKRRYASARERADKKKQSFTSTFLKVPEGTQFFQPKAGRYLMDIMPYTAGEGNKWAEQGVLYYERTFFIHRGVGANDESFICPRMTAKSPCPICEHRAKLMKDSNEDNEELIKDLAPKERQIFNVIDLKNPDKGVQLFHSSYHTFGKELDNRLRSADEEDNWDGFFTLEDGLTLKVMFGEETLGGRSFVTTENIDFRPRRDAYDEDILEKTLCLDELLIVPDYDDLKKAFLETAEDDEDDDEKPSKKAKSRDDEDEEEDDEDEPKHKSSKAKDEAPDDEDEDWDEEPKSKKKPKSDDDDEEQDEEDEEEEKSKSKKKTADDDEDDEWEEVEKKAKKKGVDDDDEEDDDDEKPKGKKSLFPRGKKGVRTADEEEEDDEDEDEDEKPHKKKSRGGDDEDDE